MATSSVAPNSCAASPVHFSPAEPRRPQQPFNTLLPLAPMSSGDIRDKIERAIGARCVDLSPRLVREWLSDLSRQSEREFAMKRELAFSRFTAADRLEMIVDGYADLSTKPPTRCLNIAEEEGELDFILMLKDHLDRIDAILGPPPLRVQAEFDIEHYLAGSNK
jgi:hypothetical protein